jgi:2-dehydro-3-deoxy-D-gluconate 5-dehydrogenase
MTDTGADVAATLESLFGLRGRSVLVTGAGRGLGQELALSAAAAGATVVAVSRTVSQLNETAKLAPRGRVMPLPWDLSEPDSADALIERAYGLVGSIHGIVHAAGAQHRSPAVGFTVDDWRHIIDINLQAPYFLSTALHRRHQQSDMAGSHVFVGSLATYIGIKGISAYGASKSGLSGVIRTLAVEWAEAGARVNGIAPGYFHTELTATLFADPVRSAWVHSRIPMGRLGVPKDLAGAVIYLLSDASSYVTGQIVSVDGGWLAG